MDCSERKKDSEIRLDHKLLVLLVLKKNLDYTDPIRRVDFRNKNVIKL